MASQKKWETDANLFCEYSKTGDKNIQELAELLKDLRETNKKLDPRSFNSVLSLAVDYATHAYQPKTIRLLASQKEMTGYDISIAFATAAELGQKDTVEYFLSLGLTSKTENSTALTWACQSGHEDIIKLLLPVSDIRYQRGIGLRTLILHNHLSVLKNIENLPSVVDVLREESPISTAVKNENIPMTKYLLQFCDPKKDESYALTVACRMKNHELLEILYPVSDVEKALLLMEAQRAEKSAADFLRARIRVDKERVLIKNATNKIEDIKKKNFSPARKI